MDFARPDLGERVTQRIKLYRCRGSSAPAGASRCSCLLTHDCAVGWNLSPLPRLSGTSSSLALRVSGKTALLTHCAAYSCRIIENIFRMP